MSDFYRFDEVNDNEGESWSFFIPVYGNQHNVQVLADRLKKASLDQDYDEEEIPYSFGEEHLTYDEVDALVKHGDHGYMPRYTKLSGLLNLNLVFEAKTYEDLINVLYKGKIAKLMVCSNCRGSGCEFCPEAEE